ncbi:hypothetical protein PsorP6_000529 [Peronosclerospora sorghi]|uniref:Uncharacterized protein n=1 Tax=Peronosclerospora sorghi TaxID=230839 RepID=A0ACC0WTT3_9STRA|nr:hypothetical protein PsorP6_000529 [Peronosclerospora sorghi]
MAFKRLFYNLHDSVHLLNTHDANLFQAFKMPVCLRYAASHNYGLTLLPTLYCQVHEGCLGWVLDCTAVEQPKLRRVWVLCKAIASILSRTSSSQQVSGEKRKPHVGRSVFHIIKKDVRFLGGTLGSSDKQNRPFQDELEGAHSGQQTRPQRLQWHFREKKKGNGSKHTIHSLMSVSGIHNGVTHKKRKSYESIKTTNHGGKHERTMTNTHPSLKVRTPVAFECVMTRTPSPSGIFMSAPCLINKIASSSMSATYKSMGSSQSIKAHPSLQQ